MRCVVDSKEVILNTAHVGWVYSGESSSCNGGVLDDGRLPMQCDISASRSLTSVLCAVPADTAVAGLVNLALWASCICAVHHCEYCCFLLLAAGCEWQHERLCLKAG